MNSRILSDEHLRHPRSQTAFHTLRLLVSGYLGISVLTLAAITLLHDDAAIVTPAVWIRGTIVTASALLTRVFVAQMAHGSRLGYIRLRVVSAVMLVAITVIIVLPDPFPLWLKVEQAICGLLLLGVVVIVNGRHLRSTFSTR